MVQAALTAEETVEQNRHLVDWQTDVNKTLARHIGGDPHRHHCRPLALELPQLVLDLWRGDRDLPGGRNAFGACKDVDPREADDDPLEQLWQEEDFCRGWGGHHVW